MPGSKCCRAPLSSPTTSLCYADEMPTKKQPRRPSRKGLPREAPVSLAPLSFEQAVDVMLAAKPVPLKKTKKRVAPRSRKTT